MDFDWAAEDRLEERNVVRPTSVSKNLQRMLEKGMYVDVAHSKSEIDDTTRVLMTSQRERLPKILSIVASKKKQ